MPSNIHQLLTALKIGLVNLYGNRLKGVYLFGSYARGDYNENSDVDVLIVLDTCENYWDELVRSGQLASDLSLEYGLTISRTIMTTDQWQNADWPILQNIRLEGIAA